MNGIYETPDHITEATWDYVESWFNWDDTEEEETSSTEG